MGKDVYVMDKDVVYVFLKFVSRCKEVKYIQSCQMHARLR